MIAERFKSFHSPGSITIGVWRVPLENLVSRSYMKANKLILSSNKMLNKSDNIKQTPSL
jgi:hypothetical protein